MLALGGASLLAFGRAAAAAPALARADRVLVLKSRRQLLLLREGRVLALFPICLGRNPVGPKRAQGDGRTPEGFYRIDRRDPECRYRHFLHISYPGPADLALARAAGVSPGGDIGIHGLPGDLDQFGPVAFDWTNGCIAVSNRAIDEIWDRVGLGTPIEIRA
jgi:murein L,D-transpeptidase YafK